MGPPDYSRGRNACQPISWERSKLVPELANCRGRNVHQTCCIVVGSPHLETDTRVAEVEQFTQEKIEELRRCPAGRMSDDGPTGGTPLHARVSNAATHDCVDSGSSRAAVVRRCRGGDASLDLSTCSRMMSHGECRSRQVGIARSLRSCPELRFIESLDIVGPAEGVSLRYSSPLYLPRHRTA